MRALRGERGAVAAELAVALPAVVLTVALGIGVLGAAGQAVSMQDAAADAARLLGRGEDVSVAAGAVTASVPGASLSHVSDGLLVCATVQHTSMIGRMPLQLSARSCALDGGR